jgi:hypothetical protein
VSRHVGLRNSTQIIIQRSIFLRKFGLFSRRNGVTRVYVRHNFFFLLLSSVRSSKDPVSKPATKVSYHGNATHVVFPGTIIHHVHHLQSHTTHQPATSARLCVLLVCFDSFELISFYTANKCLRWAGIVRHSMILERAGNRVLFLLCCAPPYQSYSRVLPINRDEIMF